MNKFGRIAGAAAALTVALAAYSPALLRIHHTTVGEFTGLKSSEREPPTFRLGNAARPFGWSTAVGDFNTDGQADVAVADHVRSSTGAYAYRIEFSVSGQQQSRVTFESTRDAIRINAVDVDHDNDLDLVVRTAVSGEAVGVWLNDGRGHFTAGGLGDIQRTIASASSIGTTEPAGDSASFEQPSPRGDDALPARAGDAPAAPAGRMVTRAVDIPRSTVLTLRQRPRAPPEIRSTSI